MRQPSKQCKPTATFRTSVCGASAGDLADLDTGVLARCPLDGCASGFLQYRVLCVIADHVIGLHQLLVAEVGVVAELKDDLEALQPNSKLDPFT